MTKPTPLTEDTLKALVQNELRQAVGFYGGKLAEQRRKAEAYYYAEAAGDLAAPDIEGRSRVVVPRVRNTILAMLPPLMVKFCGGDQVVEFEATKPGDEPKAQNATEYCNYVFFKQNNGHAVVRSWFTDALKYKNGIIKVWWDQREVEEREEYRGLTQVELAQIADDAEVEITEQKSYPDEEDAKERQQAVQQLTQQLQQALQAAQQPAPQARGPLPPPGQQPPGPPQPGQPPQPNPAQQAVQQLQAHLQALQSQPPAMLFDIVCKRTKAGGKVCVENVPPEEFGINRDAKTIAEARFLRHSVLRTLSDLRAMGYPEAKLENIGSDESSLSFNLEKVERNAFDDEMASSGQSSDVADPSQRKVWVHECYIRCDADGDGIAELRKVTLAGNELLDDEITDAAPFVSICPVPEPHKFYGLSVADLSMEGQKIETDLLRTMIDNNRLQTNGRYFAVEGQVNLDDLLMSRPGGVVRVKSPQAVGRLEQGMGDMRTPMELLQYMENFNADSTGYSSQSQSFDVEALNGGETATKTRIVSNKASMRTDDVARNFAEGFVELFRQILKLVSQYQNKAQAIRLAGQWVDMDPREWRNQFDVCINVGLGVGDKDQQVSHLTLLMQTQERLMPLGIVKPENVHAAAQELEKALGYKADKFFTKPDPNSPPPNPMQGQLQMKQMELQANGQMHAAELQQKAQIAQLEAQFQQQTDAASRQHEGQLEQMRAQMQAQVDMNRDRSQAEQESLKAHQQAQLQQLEAQYKDQQHAREQAMAWQKAQLEAATKIEVANIMSQAKVQDAATANATADLAQGLQP